ncbi:MAG: acyltransferase family protein [Muribaculaceae bacterium]|nr:acyltransferase family protein [Muribaculaceae bacterium]
MKNRIEWIDWCKSFAIFFVVWLHIHSNEVVDMVINGFIMPLFFIVSGYLFKFENNPSGTRFFIKRFRQLVVPYLWINIIAFLLWVFFLRNYGSNPLDEIEWHSPLVAIFTGVGPLLVHDIPLWSLLSFFVVEMLFYFLYYLHLRWGGILIFSFLLYCILVSFIPDTIGSLPMVVGPSIAGLIFYALGFGWRESIRPKILLPQSPKGRMIFLFAGLVVCLGLFVPAVISIGNISFYICRIGNLPGFFISSLSGSVFIIIICKLISHFSLSTPPLIRMISIGTLLICGFHLIIFAGIKGVMLLGFNISPDKFTSGFWPGLILALIIVLFSLPIIWFIRKYARPLIDK